VTKCLCQRFVPHEKPKAGKISRVGTVIRCRKCKQIGHHMSTCEKRNAPSAGGGDKSGNAQSSTTPANFSGPAHQEPPLVVSTQQSTSATAATRKRKANTTSTGTASRSLGSIQGGGILRGGQNHLKPVKTGVGG